MKIADFFKQRSIRGFLEKQRINGFFNRRRFRSFLEKWRARRIHVTQRLAAFWEKCSNQAFFKAWGDEGGLQNRALLIQLITLAVGVMGVLMLISGAILFRLEAASRRVPDEVEMPEAYIAEFFGKDGSEPRIEDYLEPEA